MGKTFFRIASLKYQSMILCVVHLVVAIQLIIGYAGCSVEDLDRTLRMLNETDMAELNFFKVGAYANDVKNIAYDNFKVKVLEKYFDMLDDKLHMTFSFYETDRMNHFFLYPNCINISYVESTSNNTLALVSQRVNASIEKAYIATYHINDTRVKAKKYEVTFAWNQNKTYIFGQADNFGDEFFSAGYFKYCFFLLNHFYTPDDVLTIPSTCKRTSLYTYKGNQVDGQFIKLKRPFLLFSERSSRIKVCNGVVLIGQVSCKGEMFTLPKNRTMISISHSLKFSTNPLRFDQSIDRRVMIAASNDIQAVALKPFHIKDAFSVTFYAHQIQALFASDGNNTYVVLNYDNTRQLEFLIGYSEPFCGSKRFFTANESRSVAETSNVGVPGRHVFLLTSYNCKREELYPYGTHCGDTEMRRGDNYAEELRLKTPIPFNSTDSAKSLFVSINGIITTDFSITSEFSFISTRDIRMVIAPYHIDFDTTRDGSIYYRETQDEQILARVNKDIELLQGFKADATHAVVFTYSNVKERDQPSLTITFQVVLAHNGNDKVHVVLNYKNIDVYTKPVSMLALQSCLYKDIGIHLNSYTDLMRSSNVGLMGKHVFDISGKNCNNEYRNAYTFYEDLRDLRIMTKGYDFVFINWNEKGMPEITVTRSDAWLSVQDKIHYCSDVNGLDIDGLDEGFSYNIQVTVGAYQYFARNVSVLPLEPLQVIPTRTGETVTLKWKTPLYLIKDLGACKINITHHQLGEDVALFHSIPVLESSYVFNSTMGSTHNIEIIFIVGDNFVTTHLKYTLQDKQVDDSESKRDIIIIASTSASVMVIVFALLYSRYQKKVKKRRNYLLPQGASKIDPDKSILEQCNNLSYDTKFEFPRKQLSLVRVLGEGAFGQVWMGAALRMDFFKPRSKGKSGLQMKRITNSTKKTLVAVKTIKGNATETEYKDLANELKLLIHIGERRNVVNVLGACTKHDNLLVILEYCSKGSLLEFVRINKYDFKNTWHRAEGSEISLHTLTWIAVQIADGMDFLERKKCVHRDLAARNILLTETLIVKIADFGLARNTDGKDYYKKETDGNLPIKWMALEAITNQKYTSKSDAWSFGVLLWEIYSFGSNPYPGVKNADVLSYLKSGKRMGKPENCPYEVYQVMLQCWSAPKNLRPAFIDLRNEIDRVVLSHEESFYSGQSMAKMFNIQPSMKYVKTFNHDKKSTTGDIVEKDTPYILRSDVTEDQQGDVYVVLKDNVKGVQKNGGDNCDDANDDLYFAFTNSTEGNSLYQNANHDVLCSSPAFGESLHSKDESNGNSVVETCHGNDKDPLYAQTESKVPSKNENKSIDDSTVDEIAQENENITFNDKTEIKELHDSGNGSFDNTAEMKTTQWRQHKNEENLLNTSTEMETTRKDESDLYNSPKEVETARQSGTDSCDSTTGVETAKENDTDSFNSPNKIETARQSETNPSYTTTRVKTAKKNATNSFNSPKEIETIREHDPKIGIKTTGEIIADSADDAM